MSGKAHGDYRLGRHELTGNGTAYHKLLRDTRPILIYFQSDNTGGHFTTIFRDFEAVMTHVKQFLKDTGGMAEWPNAELQIKGIQAAIAFDLTEYVDLWLPFIQGQWLSLTYNPHVQETYRVPIMDLAKKRLDGYLPNGIPAQRKLRVYHWTHYNRPIDQRGFDYVIVMAAVSRGRNSKGRKRKRLHYLAKADGTLFRPVWVVRDHDWDRYGTTKTYDGNLPMGKALKRFGKRIPFLEMPPIVQQLALKAYIKYWNLNDKAIPQALFTQKLKEWREQVEKEATDVATE